MQIDCYGFEATSEFFRRKELDVHLLKQVGETVYCCFGAGTRRPIHRIDRAPGGEVRVMWAYGSWDDAETLRYVPINETMEIPREEKN